jgi:hypothetical protein
LSLPGEQTAVSGQSGTELGTMQASALPPQGSAMINPGPSTGLQPPIHGQVQAGYAACGSDGTTQVSQPVTQKQQNHPPPYSQPI